MIGDIALIVIAVVLAGFLAAFKDGVNQIIRGLEAIHEELAKR